jgi:hypothetical protein
MDISQLEAEAQYEVIVKLQDKIAKLEEENSNLKFMLEGQTPLFSDIANIGLGLSNERVICEVQIALLKARAVRQELTLEESRKLQIYVDILEKLNKKEDDGIKTDLSEEQLLKLVKNE